MRCKLLFCIVLQASCFPCYHADLKFSEEKVYHTPKNLMNSQLSGIASLYNDTYFREALDNILVPRVVGTQSHENVKNYIIQELDKLGWKVELDDFIGQTPKGKLKFTNIIGKLNPSATRYLCLACHYDSKYFPNSLEPFVGATDSAVPCAMILQMAKSLNGLLASAKSSKLSVMVLFFDGEEAFHEWSESDSLYGSRNLARKWATSPFPTEKSLTNELDKIDVLVLLDLIGARGPLFYSYFRETSRWHSLLVNIERRLKSLGAIPPSLPQHFKEKSTFSSIDDDHVPFLERNVPILHLIANPFPKEWHTTKDDYSILDFPTIRSITCVLQSFLTSYIYA